VAGSHPVWPYVEAARETRSHLATKAAGAAMRVMSGQRVDPPRLLKSRSVGYAE
jgi:hypothetical protein